MRDRIPVYVITGFLGAGKTTLLNHLINRAGLTDTAVIINEFGEVGLDHLLVETSFENAVVMKSGCICCTIRGDLVDSLMDLELKRERGLVPHFSRVLVETTGLAEPAPVLHTLMTETVLTERFEVGGVITVVDALHGPDHLDAHAEAFKQAALADRLIVTKLDIAPPGQYDTLAARLRELNPSASFHRAVDGRIDPDEILRGRPFDGDWEVPPDEDHAHGSDELGHDINRHGEDIRAVTLVWDDPLDWRALKAWLESVVSLRGEDILRLKGIVNVKGSSRPIVLHGVHHVLHPPVALESWPDEDRRSRLVLICRGLDPAALRAAYDAAAKGLANAA